MILCFIQQSFITVGDIANVTDSKTLSDVVKGVGKTSSTAVTSVDKQHTVATAAPSTVRQQPPHSSPVAAVAPVSAGETGAAVPMSGTISGTRGR